VPEQSLVYGRHTPFETANLRTLCSIARHIEAGANFATSLEVMTSSLRVHRSWLAALVVAALASLPACREQPSAKQAVTATSQEPAQMRPAQPGAPELAKHESETDKRIRQEMDAVIEQDPTLKDRPISFSVDNGDITVTGTVRTETERQKINELAMHVVGVKSVANALRVSPGEGGN
jgi:BON domain-containing protein